MTLVTHQTGPQGRLVKKVLVEQGLNIAKELYLSIVPDRGTAQIVIMASEAGGMDIEAVAEATPEKIIKVYINPLTGIRLPLPAGGLRPEPAGRRAQTIHPDAQPALPALCGVRLLAGGDQSLVITADDAVLALDGKINFDDNALFRHKDILEFRDLDEENPLEVEASKFNLNYINLDGNVGNMVNGAGLAMATMDIIKLAGAAPANFLDVGGGANAEMVENGFRIILSDPNVKGILINIFGGILRCDVLAEGVVTAAKKTGIKVPVVVRMEGTNVEQGRKILAESGLNLISAKDLKDAAQKGGTIVG
jgi:succinyl-CoA synthetase beta subunit